MHTSFFSLSIYIIIYKYNSYYKLYEYLKILLFYCIFHQINKHIFSNYGLGHGSNRKYKKSDGYFQQDNAPCHKPQIISDWFLEHENELSLLKWPPQSSELNPIEHLWDVVEREIRIMDVQPTNLQQLCDAIMSI